MIYEQTYKCITTSKQIYCIVIFLYYILYSIDNLTCRKMLIRITDQINKLNFNIIRFLEFICLFINFYCNSIQIFLFVSGEVVC